MTPQFYIFLAFLLLALTAALMWRRMRAKPVDWELVVAFIRRDFPPHERDVAQEIAAWLAELVGFGIKQLRPEHTLKQITEWTCDFLSVPVEDLATVFRVEYGIACDANTTFRALVERKSLKPRKGHLTRGLRLMSKTLALTARLLVTA